MARTEQESKTPLPRRRGCLCRLVYQRGPHFKSPDRARFAKGGALRRIGALGFCTFNNQDHWMLTAIATVENIAREKLPKMRTVGSKYWTRNT